MLKHEAAAYLAGLTSEDSSNTVDPTNVHVISGEVSGSSEDGKVLVSIDGMMFSEGDDQYIEVESLGGLEDGDIATILISGEPGHGMTPFALGTTGSVDRARDLALDAQESAQIAAAAASSAQDSAEEAAEAASAAQDSADVAEQHAQQAISDAAAASTAAGVAKASADTAVENARIADEKAQQAIADAESAKNSAESAERSAQSANSNAIAALNSLSTVENVVDTLTWITKHGTMTTTTDSSVDISKVYFVLDPNGDYTVGANKYSIVQNPSDDDISTYYELSIDKSVENYIATHVSVTGEGLWLVPDNASGYRVLVATGSGENYTDAGTYIVDGNGATVARFTDDGISFNDDKSFYIGDEDAFIVFDGNGHITIGGSVTFGSNKTLSDLLSEIEQASQKADDIPIVTLSSTNGTVFKRNLGVSTTIIATIFTPGGVINNATELVRRFGSGAYLEWGWRDVVTDADHVLPVTDERITYGGFRLTINPEDINTQAVITCSLNY